MNLYKVLKIPVKLPEFLLFFAKFFEKKMVK
jgi:hypothetical protein